MPNEINMNDLPHATLESRKRLRISVVWIIPILAAVIALGIAIQRITSEGPTITIMFRAADGIEAGKTVLKYKDVSIGTVSDVQLSDDYSEVKVTAKMAKYAAGLLRDDTTFWVVAPHVSLSGVTGLNTLLSGNYIALQPGKADKKRREFTGFDVPPAITDQAGRAFVLKAATLGSIGIGAPIYYRSLNVGQVVEYALASDGKSIDIKVFVQAPYDKYVTTETRFWNASGIDVSAGADGLRVRTESLAAVLEGGVAFDTPPFALTSQPAAANAAFTLYGDQLTAMRQPDVQERRYVIYFNESIRGLSAGAPVTLLGLTVGQVTDVGLTFDPKTLLFRPRALITFSPDRLLQHMVPKDRAAARELIGLDAQARARLLRRMVEEQGLRAQLQTGSLISGELYIALDYHPQAPKPHLDWNADPLEMPEASGGLASIESKLDSILTKVDHMPLEAMGNQTRDLLATLNKTLKEAETMIARVNTEVLPATAKTLDDLHQVIANGDAALFGKDSEGPQDLRDTLQEMAGAARAVRVFVDYLQRHPEALIRGKSKPEEDTK